MMVRHQARQASLAACLIGSCLFLLGCTGGGEPERTARDGSVYQSVIADLYGRSNIAPDDELPVVFIETLGSDAIPLETQVDVVARFDETFEIRFIDNIDEAVHVDLDRQPVRSNSVLIGLGPILVDEELEVRGEIYQQSDNINAYRYSLESTGEDVWGIIGIPEPMEPEGFVPAS